MIRDCLLAGLIFASAIVNAEERVPEDLRPPSFAALEAGRSGAGGSFGGADAAIGLAYGDLVFAGFATSRAKDHMTGDVSVLRSYYAGYSYDPLGKWSFTGTFDVWGARSDLIARSLLIEASLNLDAWTFGVQPEFKSLVWAASNRPGRNQRTGAAGVHVHAEYFGLGAFTFAVRAGSINYGGERFDNFMYSYVITDSTFAQVSGLVKSYGSVSIAARAGGWRLKLMAQRSSYLIGATKSTSLSANLGWHFNAHWRVGYEFSSSKPDDSSSINANSASLGFEW